jgi:hypothetical protein
LLKFSRGKYQHFQMLLSTNFFQKALNWQHETRCFTWTRFAVLNISSSR